MSALDADYWQNRYETANTIWDIGYISTPLKNYFEQLTNKSNKILIPGAGNSYEAEYLFNAGFQHVTLLDLASKPLENFKKRLPLFPDSQLIQQDFFDHKGEYDLIIEQTFFCALDPSFRSEYAKKMFHLLKPEGKLVGLLFDDPLLEREGPPFGGTKKEYVKYFRRYFHFKVFERAYNSVEARKDRELFMILLRKENAGT